ncbi:hypothetical protein [Clostridium botulinum]|uniref:hypothetical protein n=1 Tax=Clostridium botulinum TaxID=1491 RepID=UPI000D116BDB|nr:hypothetical protein [Clostridium botulinum]AVQ45678.1 hypothetical protein C7M60_07665 [Clostridium botulinum]AVQ49617.1 hypothetical protein C7M58_09830 [Clostridium botulinum]
MPLHKIPLCSFKYVGDNTLSSGIFIYDTREGIAKDNNITKLYYKKNIEIEKGSISNLLYKDDTRIEKLYNKLFYKENNSIYKIYNYNLSVKDRKIIKGLPKNLSENDFKFIKNKNYNLEKIKINEFTRNKVVHLDIYKNLGFTRGQLKQVKIINIIELNNSNNIFNLEDYKKYKDINIGYNIRSLTRNFFKGLDINHSVNLQVYNRVTEINKGKIIIVDKLKIRSLHIIRNNININIDVIRKICIKDNIINVIRRHEKRVDISTNIYLYRNIGKQIYLNNYTKLSYKTNNFKLNKHNCINVLRTYPTDIIRYVYRKLFYINTLNTIYKTNNILGLNKNNFHKIGKHSIVALEKNITTNIVRTGLFFIENNKFKDIYKGESLGLNKSKIKISKRIHMNLIKKLRINIFKRFFNFRDLKIIKRWWVLEATDPRDEKILPIKDYNYSNKPLLVNSRIKAYGNLIEQNKHPISYAPYMDSQGTDLNYGKEEMQLSIEIMIDMINIVGMIVQHSSSQFANASGQETIEFIMELLLDWLNIETTIEAMNKSGSREHYLRTYRWIRWEAEKIWFMADKDHTQDKMMGIKYAGMLFANLIDYMKYHHFDAVPLWRNLKYMDIERQFNRVASNGDIIKTLDKLKGNRHDMIEIQNFEKKNILGGK